jgi:hypothetical protein
MPGQKVRNAASSERDGNEVTVPAQRGGAHRPAEHVGEREA